MSQQAITNRLETNEKKKKNVSQKKSQQQQQKKIQRKAKLGFWN